MSHSLTKTMTAPLALAVALLAGQGTAAATEKAGRCADMMRSMHRAHMRGHAMMKGHAQHHSHHHQMMLEHCSRHGAAAMTPAKHSAMMHRMHRMHSAEHGKKQHGRAMGMQMPMKMAAMMPTQKAPGACGTYMYWKAGQCLDARTKK